jgi:hypothetical protein
MDVERLTIETHRPEQENKEFSSQRVACEYAHAGIKRYNFELLTEVNT